MNGPLLKLEATDGALAFLRLRCQHRPRHASDLRRLKLANAGIEGATVLK